MSPMGLERGMGPRKEGLLDGVVIAPCSKSANWPFLFARFFFATTSALGPLGKSLGRRESRGRREKGRGIHPGVGDGLARGAQ